MATNANYRDPAKAAHTVQRVRAGTESQHQLPLVSQLVRLIKEISGEAEKMSLDDLVEAISGEPTTLARVMSAASTMVYNPMGGEITSLHEAVVAIGFEQVRRLAISILLLETAQSEFSAESNRELAGTALLSGMVADELARGSLTVDPDLAFICGILRSYGRMLVATFLPEEYARLVAQNCEYGGDEGFRSMFGLRPVELSHEILAGHRLPRTILDSLVHPENESSDRSVKSTSSALVLVAEFSLRLSEMLQMADLTNDNFSARLEELWRQYGTGLTSTAPDLKELLTRINVRLASYNAHCGHSIDSVVAFRRLDCLATSRPIPPVFKGKGSTTRPVQLVVNRAAGAETQGRDEPTLRAAMSLQACMDSVVRLVREPHPDPRRIFELVLQTLHKTFGLTNCLVFVKHRQSGLFRVTRGIGPLMKFAHDTVALDPEIPNVFSEAIGKGRELFIANPNDLGVRDFIPEWLCPSNQDTPIMLLPMKSNAITFAVVCATFKDSEGFGLAERIRPELLLLCNHAARVGDFLA